MSNLTIRYADDNKPFIQPIKTTHEGYAGGNEIVCIEIVNTSFEHYYTALTLEVKNVAGEDIVNNEIFTSKGWGIKLLSSEEQPTEKDWANVLSNQSLALENIGNEDNADINFIQKVWIRIFCPGNSDPDILNSMLSLKYNTSLVLNGNI